MFVLLYFAFRLSYIRTDTQMFRALVSVVNYDMLVFVCISGCFYLVVKFWFRFRVLDIV